MWEWINCDDPRFSRGTFVAVKFRAEYQIGKTGLVPLTPIFSTSLLELRHETIDSVRAADQL